MIEFRFSVTDREDLIYQGLDDHVVQLLERRVRRYRDWMEELRAAEANHPAPNPRALRRERDRIVSTIEKLETLLDNRSPLNENLVPAEDPLHDMFRRYLRVFAKRIASTDYGSPGRRPDLDLWELDAFTVALLAWRGIDVTPIETSPGALTLQIVRRAATGKVIDNCRQVLADLQEWAFIAKGMAASGESMDDWDLGTLLKKPAKRAVAD